MKRVFHFVPNRLTSGLEKVVMNICTLVDNFDFTYIVPEGPIEKELKRKNIKYIAIKKMDLYNVRKIIKIYKPDIVHGHDVKASLYLAMNSKYCKKNNIQIISELHNDDLRMHHLGLRSFIYYFYSKYFSNIVCVSNDVIDNYIFKKQIQNKVTVIKNIVNPNIVKKSNTNIDTNNIDFIFVGRLEYQKNPQLFVKIINKIYKYYPNVQVVIVGDGSLKSELVNLVNNLNLNKNIHFVGRKTNPYPYIKKSKAMIVTSRFEGFGLVALESLMLGKPVISTNVSGLREIINSKCGFISNDVNYLSKNALKLITNNVLYNEKSTNAFIRANEINDVNNFINAYKKIYR